MMNLPQIDLASIPGLETATGIFGSVAQAAASYDDDVVSVMAFVYDTAPPVAAALV